MPAFWTQEFDFYIALRQGSPLLVNLDLAALPHAPVTGYSIAMVVSFAMKHPREDGLRSNEDFDAMMQVEDLIVPAVVNGVDAIHWGRYVTQGRTDFMFYVNGELGSDLTARVQSLVTVSDYSPEVRVGQDPTWQGYLSSYPTVFLKQTMWNRKLQAQLRQQGDRLTKRRMIDHVALFTSADSASLAASGLKKGKFATGRVQGPDESASFSIEFHPKDSCDGGRPDEITIEILDIIEPLGGVYDGWGCIAQR